MSDILITVSDQSMIFTSKPVIASNGINEDYCEFTFDATWSGYAKTATFNKASEPDNVYLSVLVGNRALIPHEVLDAPGIIFIGVRGTYNDVTLTAEKLPYPIVPGADANGQNTQPPSPGIYDQILQMVLSMVGSPLVANTAADMTDEGRIYVYTGSEAGYVTGDWYYYDGATWVSGGVYNSQGIGASYLELVADYVKQSAVATFTDNTPYLYRPTPNPSAILADEKIIGGTVAWNQLVENGDFSNGTTGWNVASGRGTLSVTNNVCTYDIVTPIAGVTSSRIVTSVATKVGHKYYGQYMIKTPKATHGRIRISDQTGGDVTIPANTWTVVSGIVAPETAQSSGNIWFCFDTDPASGFAVGDDILIQNCMVSDLTAMFGSTIADYLYTLESGTAGAGVAKLKEWGFLSKSYYAYDAGSLVSVKTSGKTVQNKNLYHGSFEIGKRANSTTGAIESYANGAVSDYIRIPEGSTLAVTGMTTSFSSYISFYDKDNKYISRTGSNQTARHIISTPVNGACYINITQVKLTGQTGDISSVADLNIQVELGTVATSYTPPKSHTYPTTETALNGIFKLDASNNLYADGDVYKADGTVTRRYGIVDLGDLTWYLSNNQFYTSQIDSVKSGGWDYNVVCSKYVQSNSDHSTDPTPHIRGTNGKRIYIIDDNYTSAASFTTAMSGVYCVYPLDTETTETATPFTACQIVGKGGTEEWIDSRSVPVPVGHETVYGIGVPDVPAANGTYNLQATVNNGDVTLTWQS